MSYSFDDLADAMCVSVDAAGKRLSVSGSTLQRYREGMSEKVADRLACKAGFHPSLIWPEWGQEALERARREEEARMRVCADEKCGQRFLPRRSDQRFCCEGCAKRRRQRIRYREKRASDEAFREAEKARLRAYKAEHREGLARQRRAQKRRAA